MKQLIYIANKHGFDAYQVGDVVLVYVDTVYPGGILGWTIFPVSNKEQLKAALGY